MAFGMLDHSAGIAKAAGAEVVVFHPGFLLSRTREDAIDAVVEQLGELRERLEKKDRLRPVRRRGDGARARPRVDRRRRARSRRASTSFSRCSTSRTCTRPPTARSLDVEHVRGCAREGGRRDDAGRSRSTSTSPTSSTRTGTRRSTSPTARERFAPSRCERRSSGSSGRRRSSRSRPTPASTDAIKRDPGRVARLRRVLDPKVFKAYDVRGIYPARARRGRRVRDRPRLRRAVLAGDDRRRARHARLGAVDGGGGAPRRRRRRRRTSSTSGWSAPRCSISRSASSGSTAGSPSPRRTTRRSTRG